jgi:hypothetical protein
LRVEISYPAFERPDGAAEVNGHEDIIIFQ